jgi:hypothetical protein
MVCVTDLADRYGRRPRRPLWWIAALVVGIPFLLWLAWVVGIYSSPAVQSTEQGFDVVDEHVATMEIVVTLADDAVDPSCRVRAIADDKQPVGEWQFTPVDGLNTVEIRTERRATAVELVGCTAEGQKNAR